MSAEHISSVIDRFRHRGALPDVVQVKRRNGPVPAGAILEWSASDQAYRTSNSHWYVWPSVVSRGWGVEFGPAPAIQLRLL